MMTKRRIPGMAILRDIQRQIQRQEKEKEEKKQLQKEVFRQVYDRPKEKAFSDIDRKRQADRTFQLVCSDEIMCSSELRSWFLWESNPGRNCVSFGQSGSMPS